MTEEQRVRRNEYNRAYYAKNRDRLQANQREYEKTRRVITPERKELQQAYRKAWANKNKEKVKTYDRKCKLKKLYGMTLDQFLEIQLACKNKCAVCGRPFRKHMKEPHIDHCHKTGVVRGLLCQSCNLVEGMLKTSGAALKMYDYMKRSELFNQSAS